MRARELDRAGRTHRLITGTNLGLAASKIAIGTWATSPALIAHGVENLTDLVGNVVGWVGHRVAQRPPDEDHHYGHGNAEALASVLIGLLILFGGAGIVYRTITSGGRAEPGVAGSLALGAAIVSAVVCEAVSRRAARVARELHSQVLAALARDKRSDALSSLVVIAGVGGSLLEIHWVEPAVAVIIGIVVVILGLRSLLGGIDVLMDRVSDPRIREDLVAIAREVPGVRAVKQVRVHPLGANLRVDLEIDVDGELSVRQGHTIAHAVDRAIRDRREQVEQVHVHVNPG